MTVDAITSLRGDARPRKLQVTQLPAVVSGALSVQFPSLSHHTIRPGCSEQNAKLYSLRITLGKPMRPKMSQGENSQYRTFLYIPPMVES